MADEQAAPATASDGQAEPGRRAGPSRRTILTRLGLLVGVMVVVFVVVLPRIVDYGAVAAALSTLSAAQLAALAAATGSHMSSTPCPPASWFRACPGRMPSEPTSPGARS